MHSVTTRKAALAALLVLAALLSIFAVGKRASDPAYHQASIDALAEKQETVLELTAASTAASAAITLLPGDAATPIAEKLADLSGYFLIVLCAIFLEKYLLTITSYVSFTILIPAACALGIAALAALLSYRIFFTMAMWSYPRCAARAVRLAVTKLYTQRRRFDAEHQLDKPGEKQQH